MTRSLTLACALCIGGAVAGAVPRQDVDEPSLPVSPATVDVIERFLDSAVPPLSSYEARRMLVVSTMGGRLRASLDAETVLEADGTFRFEVLEQAGSDLLIEHVLIGALEAERRSRDHGNQGESDLTAANYDFRVDPGSSEGGLVAIRIVPRREAPLLLQGIAMVRSDDGDLVQIEGRPVERPSWWTKQIDIVRRYARVAGVRVPVEMTSRAEVRIAGEATFSMTYDYRSINGRPVGRTSNGAVSDPVDPSSRAGR